MKSLKSRKYVVVTDCDEDSATSSVDSSDSRAFDPTHATTTTTPSSARLDDAGQQVHSSAPSSPLLRHIIAFYLSPCLTEKNTSSLPASSPSSPSSSSSLSFARHRASSKKCSSSPVRRCIWLGFVVTTIVMSLQLSQTAQNLKIQFLRVTSSRPSNTATMSSSLSVPKLSPSGVVEESRKNETTHDHHYTAEKECTVWMAPSSLPGDFSGYGIFVTRDLKQGESILGEPDGVGIPIQTYYNPRTSSKSSSTTPQDAATMASFRKWQHYFGEYVWAHGMPDHVMYDSPPGTVDYQTGMGSLPNHHCILSHLNAIYPNPSYDDSIVNRYRDPGVGAFSYHRGREFIVDHNIEAGDEIFLNYGLCSPDVRQRGGDWTDQLLITKDFVQAANIMRRTLVIMGFNTSTHLMNNPHIPLTFDAQTGNAIITPLVNPYVKSLLPKSIRDFDAIFSKAGKGTQDDTTNNELPRQIARYALNRRTPQWIRQHGTCLENLVGRVSTIHGAGLGAFAKRTLRRDDIITPAPLLQILDREALTIYGREKNQTETQLLLNYCFGHSQSSILLCPNTNAVLINHCSMRTKDCGPHGPNADYRWASDKWDESTTRWLNMSVDELAQQSGHGLAMEIVATRDILPGEEIFIDYGLEWEQAWHRHVANWKPHQMPTTMEWITAKEANDHMGPILDALVSGNLRETVSHPYLFTGCQYWETSWDHQDRYITGPRSWHDLSDEDILSYFSDPGDYYAQSNRESAPLYATHRDKSYWPCSVLRREADGYYTVRIHKPFFANPTAWDTNGLPRLVTNYSRDLIHYFVVPYQSDHHLPGVFRHSIGIRDEMFPPQWKNIIANQQSH